MFFNGVVMLLEQSGFVPIISAVRRHDRQLSLVLRADFGYAWHSSELL